MIRNYFYDFKESKLSDLFVLVNKDSKVDQYFLWAKKIDDGEIYKSFAKLILKIGKDRLFEKFLPPLFLGVFDYNKISFIDFSLVSELFFKNDFNWRVKSSNMRTKEFLFLINLVKNELEKK